MVIYLTLTIHPAFLDLGHDGYGLRRLFTIVGAIFSHIILGALFAIGYRLKTIAKKTNN